MREEVGRELQATLVELVDLSLIGKQLHWSVVGPLFRPLHLQLDELVDSWRGWPTRSASGGRDWLRARWQAQALTAGSELAPVERGALEDHVVVRELTHRIAEASERARGRMDRLGELDAASQDVVIEVVRALEEQRDAARPVRSKRLTPISSWLRLA